ncbi:MAG: peptide chain release factor N(5)-glutamine methyltransferase [Opitutales bacterium]|nr:peptide chain release factor N(5)-glutamine methyltransferase [Opitutales bacterium]
MQSVLDILGKTTGYFEKAGVPQARLDAEHLLAHVLGCKRLGLYLQFERPLTEGELGALRPLVRRRARREPLQHILGTVDFHGLTLRCDARALVPRPETEWLAERVAERLKDRPPARIADLGTGTGALALALATAFPEAGGGAGGPPPPPPAPPPPKHPPPPAGRAERARARGGRPGARPTPSPHGGGAGGPPSPDALALARENAAALGLAERVCFHGGDWFAPLAGRRYDCIVANPPYLSEADWEAAEPEVARFDPKGALVAPDNGTADLVRILRDAPAHLNPGGLLALETNDAQHASLAEYTKAPAYASAAGESDYAKRERYLFLTVS